MYMLPPGCLPPNGDLDLPRAPWNVWFLEFWLLNVELGCCPGNGDFCRWNICYMYWFWSKLPPVLPAAALNWLVCWIPLKPGVVKSWGDLDDWAGIVIPFMRLGGLMFLCGVIRSPKLFALLINCCCIEVWGKGPLVFYYWLCWLFKAPNSFIL